MGRAGKKPRKKMDPRKFSAAQEGIPVKKEDVWSFEDIARSKFRRH